MKLLQYSCKESGKIDLRQARSVLKHKPSFIVFEAPANNSYKSKFNKFPTDKKPLDDVEKYKKMLLKISKKHKWVKSDIYVYNNIVKLWKSNHDVKIYNVDAPKELLSLSIKQKWDKHPYPYKKGTNFAWWVYIYLREKIMTENIKKILKETNKNSTGLIFLQKFHWLNVQFQLKNKSKKDIFNYYFNKFDQLLPANINEKIRNLNIPVLIKFWKKYSNF